MTDLHRRATDLSGARLGIYARASDDAEDTETSVLAQENRGTQWAESVGITDITKYCDNDLSASLYATKERDDFDRLWADVEAGRLDLVWFWTLSRQQRRLDVYVRFRDLCRRMNVAWVVKRRVYDLNDPSDLRALGNDAVNNEVFSLELSENVKLGNELRASRGLPFGVTPFGYIRSYDHRRRFVGQDPDERPVPLIDADGSPRVDEHGDVITTTPAAIVREIFARCADREELYSIVQDFEERGIPTPRNASSRRTSSGTRWASSTVRRIALNRAYLGILEYNGKVIERPEPCWTPLLQNADGSPDEATFYAARNYLLDPSRKVSRATHNRHLLTNLIHCGECGGTLVGVHPKQWRAPYYRCWHPSSHVSITKDDLDEFVSQVMAGYLAREDVYADLMGAAADASAERGRISAELQRLWGDLEEWQQLAEQGEVSPSSFARAEKGIAAKIKTLESDMERLSAPPLLAGRIGPNPSETWDEIDFHTKRKIIRLCADIRIRRVLGSGRSRVHVSERVEWRWKIGPAASMGPVEFPAVPDTDDPLNGPAEQQFAEMLAAGRLPGVQLIRNTMRVGRRRALIIQAHLRSIAPETRLAKSKNDFRLSETA
jgi:site-specific DNA recombinase